MKLSDMIRALEYIRETQGDLPVLEERSVWYDTFELFPNDIRLDEKIRSVASYQDVTNKARWDEARRVDDKAKDRREFLAFVIGTTT